MRRFLVLALAACGRVTSTAIEDAAIDAGRPWFDATPFDAAPLDAYAPAACDAPLTFADGRTWTRVLHVRPGATNGDGSAATPFGTIAAAAAVATPGTFIQLEPGTHTPNQFVPNLRGTADAPIWIGGAWGTHPQIVGGTEALHLTNPAYVVVQNLTMAAQSAIGLTIDDGVGTGQAHHVLVSGVAGGDVTVSGPACLRASGVDDLYVYDSNFQHCNYGIDLVGVHRGVVARNLVGKVVLAAVQVRGGSADVDVRQNKIWDSGNVGISLGGATPLAWFRPPASLVQPNAEARRVRAFDNIVRGDTLTPFVFATCVECLVAHNLTYGTPSQVMRIEGTPSVNGYPFEPTRDGRVINNSFVWSASIPMHVAVGTAVALDTFTFSHDLWSALGATSQSPPAFFPSMAAIPDTGAVIGAGTGYQSAFVPLPPYCGGPEAGAAAPLPEVDGTIEGTCRAGSAQPTIGPQLVDPISCVPF